MLVAQESLPPAWRTKDGAIVKADISCVKHPAIKSTADGLYLFVDSTQLSKGQWVVITDGTRAVQLNAKAIHELLSKSPAN